MKFGLISGLCWFLTNYNRYLVIKIFIIHFGCMAPLLVLWVLMAVYVDACTMVCLRALWCVIDIVF